MSRRTRKPVAQAPRRSCGACHACCIVLPIVSAGWEKAEGARCRHLDEGGKCGVYDARPATCRDFECAWRAGRLPFEAEWRPDRLGLLLTGMVIDGDPLTYAYEVWRGASRTHPPAVSLLSALASDQLVVVVDAHPPDPGKRVVGPSHLQEALMRRHGA